MLWPASLSTIHAIEYFHGISSWPALCPTVTCPFTTNVFESACETDLSLLAILSTGAGRVAFAGDPTSVTCNDIKETPCP